MGKKVEVDYQALEDAIQEMNDAKDEFHSCVENGFKTELENLDSMNSDFVDKLTRVLEISKKWNMDTLETNQCHLDKVFYDENSISYAVMH